MTAALFELAALVALATVGWLLVPARHGAAWRVAAALPVGAAAYTTVMLVLLVTFLPVAHPWVALGISLVGALVVRRSQSLGQAAPLEDGDTYRWFAGAGALGLLALVVTAVWPVANMTADSFRYITVGQLLAREAGTTTMSTFLLQSRGLATGAVHGLALPSMGYLRAFGPLLAASVLAVTWLLIREGLPRLDPTLTRWVAAGAVAVLVTNHRFIFSALYVNGHMQFAAWLLLLVAITWRVLRAAEIQAVGAHATGRDVMIAVTLVAAITVVRPEGALIVLLALAPAVFDARVPLSWRRILLVGAGGASLLWHLGVLVALTLRAGRTVQSSITGMIAVGIGTGLLALMLGGLDGRLGRRPLVLLHGGAWVLVAGLSIRQPETLVVAAKSTARNLTYAGSWGSSLLVLAVLLAIAVVARRAAAEQALLFPLLTFVPVAILLAFLRGGAYRVGPGDSLNRMLLHVLPIAVVALALTAAGDDRKGSRSLAAPRRRAG